MRPRLWMAVWMFLAGSAIAGQLERRFLPNEPGQITTSDGTVVKLLGVNIPTGWNNGWKQLAPEQWRKDLDLIAGNGMNAVRIFLPFVPPASSGHPTNKNSWEYLRDLGYVTDGKLRGFIEDAEKRGISVTVSFFDLNRSVPAKFDVTDPLYRAQLDYLKKVTESLGDSKWVIYDLMNEPENHLISLPEQERAHARDWIKALARELRRLDNNQHLIFLHTMSDDKIGKSRLLEDRELWGLLDGITIHTGDTREIFCERAGELQDFVRSKGLILMWGEFGGGSAGDAETAAYVRRAIRQLELNNTAGGFLWQLKSTGVGGGPMVDQDGNPHPSGIEEKPAVLAALKELGPGFATSLLKPSAHSYEVRKQIHIKQRLAVDRVVLPRKEEWHCRGLTIELANDENQTVSLRGAGDTSESFGSATASIISTDLDIEKLTLACNVKELEGEYFLFVGDGQTMVYVVRDSDRMGVRPMIDLSRILIDAGFQGKVTGLQLQVGLVNNKPGAHSTEGTKAKMVLILGKNSAHDVLEQHPGKLPDSKQ